MSESSRFHSQLASIMEALANAAVAEICELVDDGYAVLRLEISRREKENEALRRKLLALELRAAREKAQRSGSWACEERIEPRVEPHCRVKPRPRSRATVRIHEEPHTSPPVTQVLQAEPKEECEDVLIIESGSFQAQDCGHSATDGQVIQPIGRDELEEQNLFAQRIEAVDQSLTHTHSQTPLHMTHTLLITTATLSHPRALTPCRLSLYQHTLLQQMHMCQTHRFHFMEQNMLRTCTTHKRPFLSTPHFRSSPRTQGQEVWGVEVCLCVRSAGNR
ncbi:hypothetical protein MHYP_G00234980 [Metynnis hypsauchen]